MKFPALPRPSIAVQLVALMLACLGAMHLLLFVVVGLLPPPRPPLYRIPEIAAALNGGALSARFGRPMTRTIETALPAELARERPFTPIAQALAIASNRSAADVRLAPRPPSAIERFFHEPVTRRVVIEHRRMHRFRESPAGSFGSEPPPSVAHAFHLRVMARELPVFGDFTAAARQPDGRWVVVRSTPEPFPTDWQKRTLLLILGGFMVVAPAGLWFARRITAPLKRFSEAAERLGRDPHAPPVTLTGPAEIGAAAEAFNNMQARLRRYIDDRTAMVGAISHDLRTPLARIRFKMEGAGEDLRGSVLGDVAQMEQMINGVLAFIRDESTPRRRERLDLLSLLECVADDAAMLGGDVEVTSSEPVTVDGDAVALQRLFVNLVDNAVKYGGRARIALRREGGQAVVDIADGGPGLAPEELARAFEPFYRADPSRNVDAGGIGLGLPIARSTARAHGGDVELASTPDGLRATVVLPVA